MIFPSQPKPEAEDEPEFAFEPDEVSMYIAEQLNDAGFSPENSWLIATRHNDVDWHRAVEMLKKGWSQLDVVKALV